MFGYRPLLAEKESGVKNAKKKIQLFISKINIADADKKCVSMALQHKAIEDFEDGRDHYAALQAGCSCTTTEDINDFYFSEIDVLNSQQFIIKDFKDRSRLINFRYKCSIFLANPMKELPKKPEITHLTLT